MDLEWLAKPCLGLQKWLYGISLGRKIIGSILDILSSRWLWCEVLVIIGIELNAVMYETGSSCYGQSGRKSVNTCGTLRWPARVTHHPDSSRLRSFFGCRRSFQCQKSETVPGKPGWLVTLCLLCHTICKGKLWSICLLNSEIWIREIWTPLFQTSISTLSLSYIDSESWFTRVGKKLLQARVLEPTHTSSQSCFCLFLPTSTFSESHWQIVVGHHERIYTMEISKYCK